jgi:hypothetical protein
VDTPSSGLGARKLRILLANEPRAYREAIAQAIHQLRPDVEIETAEPPDLDSSIRRFVPDMVVCSEATDTVRSNVRVWVELYPEHNSRSVANIAGKYEEYPEIQLSDLLSIVDRTGDLTRLTATD